MGKFLAMPKYEHDQSQHLYEYNVPDPNYYLELGYDKLQGSGEKHYRYLVKVPLEESQYIEPTPFHCYDLWRG